MVGLAFVALLAVSDDTPFPSASPELAAKALGSMGYRFDARDERSTMGKLAHDGSTVDAYIDVQGPTRRGDPPGPVRGLQLSIELAFPQEIPLDLDATNVQDGGPPPPFLFVPHLGKTVSATCRLGLSEGTTQEAVRKALDGFWRQTSAYARLHGGGFVAAPETDWTKVRFSDDVVLRVADEVSLTRLITSWDWWPRHGGGGSTAGWIVPLQIEGKDLILWQGGGEEIPPGRSVFLFGTVELPKAFDVGRWYGKYGKRFAWAVEAEGDAPIIRAKTTIDLRQGLRLGDLRRQIKSFALQVGDLQGTIRGT